MTVRRATPLQRPLAAAALAALIAGAALFALIAAGCAPHLVPVAELTRDARASRYRTQLAARESLGAAVDERVVLWPRRTREIRLPSAEGRLLLAAPDAFRLRIDAVVGTAIDLGARGDSLTAYVPSRRQAVALDAARDTLGLLAPGGLGFRTMSATWRIPDGAWRDAAWADTLLCPRWLERDDTVAVAVGSHGLPVWASLTRAGHGGVRVAYRQWDRSNGAPWPAVLEISDLHGPLAVTFRISVMRFERRPDAARLVVPIPATAERLTFAELKRVLERLGVM
ncbi:MAG: hypothetical protein HY076_05160 [Candidatus Eisenbacteria bacterium]|uniref:DUF4292 domain-containing protein n=1 Tax=Eiseniibacteriota bacterium TaxID=2212470 RepID=A0A9D6L6R2_UNCEI|nr:hypothetical protein [Candidatus Eisenbacteria bacterium]MBI3539641.1 hypothetical protein [Candidatus Eisenbacteria bacterium]